MIRATVIAFSLALFTRIAASGTVLHVPADFPTIQAAIDAAGNGDEVVIADGVYSGPGNRVIDFQGKEITVRSAHGPEFSAVDCQNAGRGFLFFHGEGQNSVLEGLTIRNCSAPFFGDNFGGGILIQSSSPTIRNCVISDCFVGGLFAAGGGMFCDQCNATIIGCKFIDNISDGSLSNGGGLFCQGGSPTIRNSLFRGNTAGFLGGGLVCTNNCNLRLIESDVIDNDAGMAGGMQSGTGSAPRIERCRFLENTAGSTGGIVFSAPATAVVSDTAIIANLGFTEGGGISCFSGANPLITRCTIADNLFVGIACFGGEPTISNSVLTGNTDDLGDCASSYCCVGDGDEGEGNIGGDPLLIGSGNYRLRPESPCVDAGDPKFIPQAGAVDLDGHARVFCQGLDIGAYEFGLGDFDCSRSIDSLDYQEYMTCITGPGDGSAPSACTVFDGDSDGSIDLRDFAAFQNAFTGVMEEP